MVPLVISWLSSHNHSKALGTGGACEPHQVRRTDAEALVKWMRWEKYQQPTTATNNSNSNSDSKSNRNGNGHHHQQQQQQEQQQQQQ